MNNNKRKHLSFFSLLLTIIIIVSMFTSCSEGGEKKNITYPLSSSPHTLDPQYAYESGALTIINNCFEGLVRYNEKGEIIPGIAKSWSCSDDGLTWTFYLKEGTEWYCPVSLKKEFGDDFYNKFSSEKVTANDFVFACQRAVSPETGSSHAHRLFPIKNASQIYNGQEHTTNLGVYAPDNYTLVFELWEKCNDFLNRLTESEFMPCNKVFFEKMAGRYGLSNKHILCNGPFYVSSWVSDTSLTIKANKYYSGAQAVIPSSVIFSFDSNQESVLNKLSTATLSAAFLSPDVTTPSKTVVSSETENAVFGFVFNCEDAVYSNTSLRKAICYGIKRDFFNYDGSGFIPASCKIGSTSYKDLAQTNRGTIDFSKEISLRYYNQALTELEKESISLNILCPLESESNLKEQIQIWQKLFGINFSVTIEPLDYAQISEKVNNGDFQLALMSLQSEYDTAVDYLSSFYDGGIFGLDIYAYDSVIDKLKTLDSQKEILEGCYTAEKYVLENGIFYPLCKRSSRLVTNKDISGIYIISSESTICFINARRFD